ncbi:MAG: hypothetical protein CMLOHMNK_01678 [Steroidobacteraceae bacterium]|nr:hypothetical protein [Steroidobacteraceae bacterium]
MAMLTHIEIDDALLEQLFKLQAFPTRKAAVNTALAEYVNLLKRRRLLEQQGKVPWHANLDELRARREK